MRNKSNKNKPSGPCCVFCGTKTGQFVIFSPRFEPFGTACVQCEESLPPGTKVPEKTSVPLEVAVATSFKVKVQQNSLTQ